MFLCPFLGSQNAFQIFDSIFLEVFSWRMYVLFSDTTIYAMQVIRMVVSTYQAASGAGAAAMEELELQTREVSSLFPPSLGLFL